MFGVVRNLNSELELLPIDDRQLQSSVQRSSHRSCHGVMRSPFPSRLVHEVVHCCMFATDERIMQPHCVQGVIGLVAICELDLQINLWVSILRFSRQVFLNVPDAPWFVILFRVHHCIQAVQVCMTGSEFVQLG